jgi:hypothetical protein
MDEAPRRGRDPSASLLMASLLALVPLVGGCRTGPKSFASVNDPSPLMRARAIGLGEGQPDAVAVPALLSRLSDPDPVVRLAAHEAIKKRSGQDFGYQPYREPNEQPEAIAQWQAWWQARASQAGVATATRETESVTRGRGWRRRLRQ